MQIINNWSFWIWKNKFIIYSKKSPFTVTEFVYMFTDPYEAKYQILINKGETAGLENSRCSMLLLNTQIIWIKFIKMLRN